MVTAALGLWVTGAFSAHASPPDTPTDPPEPAALLFENGILEHATDQAARLLQLRPGTDDWHDLCDAIADRFPNFPRMVPSGSRGNQTFDAVDGHSPAHVQMRWRGDRCWISLPQTLADRTGGHPDSIAHLQRAHAASPHPVWAVDKERTVIWSNPAFQALSGSNDPTCTTAKEHPLSSVQAGDAAEWIAVERSTEGVTDWFEVRGKTIAGVTYFHGKCVTAQHHAEVAKRNFVQTLSKTFAHLPIGLAIFDKNGQLALFNPALVDLTGLSGAFLSGQPTMISFFDQLREHRRMPEPKNYATWREEIAEMISAATDGRYQETWSLEGGQTFNVQGRPHPDGATAFLIEDISAEVMLTRNFRAELELGQALFDSFDQALVVFSPAGVLTFSNDAYRQMWGQNPDVAFADMTIADAISLWQDKSSPGAPWPEIADFVSGATHQQQRDVMLPLIDGTQLHCRMRAIATGARLIRFDPVSQRHVAHPVPATANLR